MHRHHRFRTIRPVRRRVRLHRHHIRQLVILKVIIMIGILATYFLPPVHAAVVGAAANILWLWS
jgi:hypothetical protein